MSKKQRHEPPQAPGDFPKALIRPKLEGFERAVFATNTVVNHTPREFCITFLQVLQPVGPPWEIDKLKELPGHCVARVVLTPDHMEALLDAIQKNLAKFNQNKQRYAEMHAKLKQEEEEQGR